MKKLLLIAWISVGLISCNSQQTKQTVKTNEYTCNEIGWTIHYPNDWKVLSKDEIAIIEGRGRTAMESTINEEIPLNNNNLLWLKKDQFNSFTSTIQPYDTIEDGSYSENQELLTQLMVDTYTNQGLQFDYKSGKELVDGLEFTTFESVIYTPDRKKIILNQIMYDRLINGKTSLTFSINYNNDKDKQALMEIIKTSKLTQRQ
jgi:hypothetical protein